MANRWQLQDGSGLWLLQDGSGYWLLQDSAAVDDVVGVDSGTASEQSATVGDGVATETGTLSEARLGTVDAVAPDTGLLVEAQLGTLDAIALDAGALADAGLGLAESVDADTATVTDSQVTARVDFPDTLETFTLSESAVGELGTAQDDVVASDSAILAEIEALLADLNAADNATLSERVDEPLPPAPAAEPEFHAAIVPGWRRIEEVPDEDEELALAGYVSWYY